MKKIDISTLHKVINGTASQTEVEKFTLWLKASQAHKDYFERLKQYQQKNIEDLNIELISPKTGEFVSKLNKKSRKLKIQKILRYAAVLFMPIALATFLWIHSQDQLSKTLVKNTPELSEEKYDKTMLISSSGNTYELNDSTSENITNAEGVKLGKNLQEGLFYKAKEKQSAKPV